MSFLSYYTIDLPKSLIYIHIFYIFVFIFFQSSYLFTYQSIFLYIKSSTYVSIYEYINACIYSSIYLSIYFYLSIYLSSHTIVQWKCNFLLTPLSVCRLFGPFLVGLLLDGPSVCHDFLKGWEVKLPCSFLLPWFLDNLEIIAGIHQGHEP